MRSSRSRIRSKAMWSRTPRGRCYVGVEYPLLWAVRTSPLPTEPPSHFILYPSQALASAAIVGCLHKIALPHSTCRI
ncbi:hypothetical protein EV356DRAFT_111520 [Viridothelium virens]|uniref:Uncharacterized protein n=1 Tax=Viridothelium virens TaxID=1048519 RepID=A0A6A6HBP4_VIRVR|nr:hypothetical protein EV356DRAFT_111520 [Viridothelium virens]